MKAHILNCPVGNCQSGFTILSLVPLQEQSVVVLYWRGLGSHKV
jgi:hypothetical protein